MSGTNEVTVFEIPVEGMLYFIDGKRSQVPYKHADDLTRAEAILRRYERPESNFEPPISGQSAYGEAYKAFEAAVGEAVRLNRECGIGEEEIEDLRDAQETIRRLIDHEWDVIKRGTPSK